MSLSLLALVLVAAASIGGAPTGAVAAVRCVPAPFAVLTGCNFDGLDLSNARLGNADLAGASFVDTNLGFAHLTNAQLPGADLRGAVLTHAVLAHVKMERSDVAGAYLDGDLFRVVTGGLVGRPAQLPKNWRLVDGYLIGPTAKLINAKLARADLAGARLGDAYLFGADLAGADLSRARLPSAHLGRANLRGANLSGVVLRAAELRFANLDHANLTGAVIAGSDLRSAHLVDTTLTGVLWRNDVCPNGDSSASKGGTCVQSLRLHPH